MSQMGIFNNQKTINCQVYRTQCRFRIQIKIHKDSLYYICIVYYINYNNKHIDHIAATMIIIGRLTSGDYVFFL